MHQGAVHEEVSFLKAGASGIEKQGTFSVSGVFVCGRGHYAVYPVLCRRMSAHGQ